MSRYLHAEKESIGTSIIALGSSIVGSDPGLCPIQCECNAPFAKSLPVTLSCVSHISSMPSWVSTWWSLCMKARLQRWAISVSCHKTATPWFLDWWNISQQRLCHDFLDFESRWYRTYLACVVTCILSTISYEVTKTWVGFVVQVVSKCSHTAHSAKSALASLSILHSAMRTILNRAGTHRRPISPTILHERVSLDFSTSLDALTFPNIR